MYSKEKDEACLGFVVKIFTKSLHRGGVMQGNRVLQWWAGWALVHPEFGVSVNPIPTRGRQIMPTALLLGPGFENLKTSLYYVQVHENQNSTIYIEIWINFHQIGKQHNVWFIKNLTIAVHSYVLWWSGFLWIRRYLYQTSKIFPSIILLHK